MPIQKTLVRKIIERDNCCPHCGAVEAISIHHRKNRGMGGSKKLDYPANLMVLCSQLNSLIEADAEWRRKALTFGWKLSPWDDPLFVPVWDRMSGVWWRLDDTFGRWPVEWDDRPF